MDWLTVSALLGVAALVVLPRVGLGPLKSLAAGAGSLVPSIKSTKPSSRQCVILDAVCVHDRLVAVGATKEAAEFAKAYLPLLLAQESNQ